MDAFLGGVITAAIFGVIFLIYNFVKKTVTEERIDYSVFAIDKEIDTKDPQLLLEELDKFLTKYPESSISYYQRGLVYMKLHKYDYAVMNFSRCIYQKPADELINLSKFNRGKSYYFLNNYEEAIKDLESVKDIPEEYDLKCIHCEAENILEDAEIENQLFICFKCNKENRFDNNRLLGYNINKFITDSKKQLC